MVRSVPYGESDSIVTLLTEKVGKLGALVRGARKSTRRVVGALEPFHTLEAMIDDKGGDALAHVREARVVRMRMGIVSSLEALDAAGAALRWARHLFPNRTREPEGWTILNQLLDGLDEGAEPRRELASTGLRLLAAVGYALDFERCVRCGRPCPDGRPSYVDAGHGGLVCRACGGSKRVTSPEVRDAARAMQRGEAGPTHAAAVSEILTIVDEAMAAHAGFEG